MKTMKPGLALCAALLVPGAALAQESPLGSPAAAATRYSTDYAEAVRAAMPHVDAGGLERLMDGVRHAAPGGLAVRTPQEAGKALGLRLRDVKESEREIDAGEALVRIDPARGRVRAMWRPTDAPPMARESFAPTLPDIRRAHDTLVARLGIDRRDVYFVDFREVLSQTDAPPAAGKPPLPIVAEGATSTYLRATAGVLVEGSYARVTSTDAKRLAGVDVRWPAVKLAEEVRSGTMRPPQEVLPDLVRRVEGSAKGMPVNVRMAIVLRPVDGGRPGVYVPALKVGIKPQSVRVEDGYRTDAGEVFYSDLLRTAPPIVTREGRDVESSPPG